MSGEDVMSDSNVPCSSESSASDGEYLIQPQDVPQFDISQWTPELPAGIQCLSLLPLTHGYQVAASEQQRIFVGKEPRCRRLQRLRDRESTNKRALGRNVHDEKKLRTAVQSENLQLVEELLDSGVEPTCVDDQKRSPLHIAATTGNKDLVTLLLDRGANPNQKDVIGNTPLHLAACTNKFNVVTVLLKAGTDVHSLDNSGHTPLHLARSRLRMMLEEKSKSSDTYKQEMINMILMMKEYLRRKGKAQETQELDQISHQLTKLSTNEDLDSVTGVLSNFASLQIENKTDDQKTGDATPCS